MQGQATSSSATPNAAPITAKTTPPCAPRRKQRGGQGWLPSCASAKRARNANRAQTLDVLSRQIAGSVASVATAKNTVVAYEPVWAIGTGLTPTVADVAEAHAHIRARLREKLGAEADRMRILYGGSVKPSNATELLAIENVDGALVGGASLKAADFLGIAESYEKIG